MSRRQLLAAGHTASAINRRLANGELRPIHSGVYFVGPGDPSLHGRAWAALLAAGPGAAISHRTAAELEKLLDERPGPIHITVRGRRKRRLDGVVIHRPHDLPRSQVSERDGLPITTTARTIVDLAATEDAATLQRALNQGCYLRTVRLQEVRAMKEGMRRGKARLERALADATRARSPLEDRFYALVRAAELPPPVANFRIGPYVVDFYWPEHRLVVEVDGGGHDNEPATAHDERKDAYMRGRGLSVDRVKRRTLDATPTG